MTMDMGGAGVVVGTMLSLAKRKAKANVVGLVGLVKICHQAHKGLAILSNQKGDTIEVIIQTQRGD